MEENKNPLEYKIQTSTRTNTYEVDPETGFLSSPEYAFDFDAPKKKAFLNVYKKNGLKFWKSAQSIGVRGDTIHKHVRIDPAFSKAMKQVEEEYFDELEGVSRENALNPRSVIERIFQLKSRFPLKYGDAKRLDSQVNVSLSIDQKLLEAMKKRQEVIDIQEQPQSDLSTNLET